MNIKFWDRSSKTMGLTIPWSLCSDPSLKDLPSPEERSRSWKFSYLGWAANWKMWEQSYPWQLIKYMVYYKQFTVPCQCPFSPLWLTFYCFSPTHPASLFVLPPGTHQTRTCVSRGLEERDLSTQLLKYGIYSRQHRIYARFEIRTEPTCHWRLDWLFSSWRESSCGVSRIGQGANTGGRKSLCHCHCRGTSPCGQVHTIHTISSYNWVYKQLNHMNFITTQKKPNKHMCWIQNQKSFLILPAAWKEVMVIILPYICIHFIRGSLNVGV